MKFLDVDAGLLSEKLLRSKMKSFLKGKIQEGLVPICYLPVAGGCLAK